MVSTSSINGAEVGACVAHRRYVPYSHAHYAGNLVDGAYSLGLFGDVATEMCIATDGDEGLFASYSDVQFHAQVRAGDVLEVVATVTRMGTRIRTIDFACRVVCRGASGRGESAANFGPGNGLHRSAIDLGHAAGHLGRPRGLGVLVHLGVKAL